VGSAGDRWQTDEADDISFARGKPDDDPAGNLDQFYEVELWPGWQQDLRTLTGDQGFSIYPPLWSQEGRGGNRSRRAVPMAELWRLYVNG
jgi:hypothetical protein